MSRDSMKQQILEACGRVKSAAEAMGFLMSVMRMRKRDFPDDAAGSPRLMVTISITRLAEKIGYGRTQTKKAVKLLCTRGFITAHFSEGDMNQYQVNEGAIERWLQRMPLFEENDNSDLVTQWPGTRSLSDHPPGHSVTGYLVTQRPGPPYIASKASISIKEFADADIEILEEEKSEGLQAQANVQPHALPGQGSSQADADADREELIAEYRALNISLEQTEHFLAIHTRQKLQAAMQSLKVASRYRIIGNPGGWVVGFLSNPAKYGYELDSQGCWRSSKEIAIEQKRRHAVKARDRPALSDSESLRRAAALAWEALSYDQQQAIKQQIQTDNPDTTPVRRHQLSQERALALTEESAHGKS